MDVRLATPEQLASAMQQSFGEQDAATAELWLDVVSSDVIEAARTDFSDLPAVPMRVVGMVCRLAAELFSSPGGRQVTAESIDDYRVQMESSAGRAPGELTDTERRRLRARYGPEQHHSARLRTCP